MTYAWKGQQEQPLPRKISSKGVEVSLGPFWPLLSLTPCAKEGTFWDNMSAEPRPRKARSASLLRKEHRLS